MNQVFVVIIDMIVVAAVGGGVAGGSLRSITAGIISSITFLDWIIGSSVDGLFGECHLELFDSFR